MYFPRIFTIVALELDYDFESSNVVSLFIFVFIKLP